MQSQAQVSVAVVEAPTAAAAAAAAAWQTHDGLTESGNKLHEVRLFAKILKKNDEKEGLKKTIRRWTSPTDRRLTLFAGKLLLLVYSQT